jgi:D-alanyl-D-alanine carboxypeptidase
MKGIHLSIICLFLCLTSCKNEPKADNDTLVSKVKSSQIKTKKNMETHLKNLNTDYCMGRFEPKAHDDFTLISIKYADREGMYLRKDVLVAFESMFSAAKKEGINLQIRSATRNFDYQKGIWERKWTGTTLLSDGTNVDKDIQNPTEKALKILEYSSMPGTSRHHWGTDIDLNSFNNSYFEKGEGKLIYDWLNKNAAGYGFCQPYTPKGENRPFGYNEEKWHWTYKPLGSEITAFAEKNLKNIMITGFKGAETATEIDVVGKYVLGINQGCNH